MPVREEMQSGSEDDAVLCIEGKQVNEKVRNAATIKMRPNDRTTNVLLDSGALMSVIDHGSFLNFS